MKNAKIKIFVKIAFFLAILLVLIQIFNVVVLNAAIKHQNKEALGTEIVDLDSMREKVDTIDILALGDSESYTSFSPMDLWEKEGVTSFVLAKSGQRISDAYHILKNNLKRQNPKAVFLETNMLFETYGRLHDYTHNLKNALFYDMALVKYHSVWKILFEKDEQRYQSYKGFNFYVAKVPYTGNKNYMKEEKYHNPFLYGNKLIFEKIVKMCKKRKIKLIMYSAPSPNNYSKSTHDFLTALAKENNLEYIDMNLMVDNLGIDWNIDSLDNGDHVNVSGTNKIMNYFSSYIKAFKIKDKRRDKKYSDWNKELSEYASRRDVLVKNIRNN